MAAGGSPSAHDPHGTPVIGGARTEAPAPVVEPAAPASEPGAPAVTEHRVGIYSVRYGIGIVLCVASIVLLVVNPGGFGVDGFAMCAGSGLSVLMINALFRLGVRGDLERDDEEDARRYMAAHGGRWPDEKPRA